MSDVDLIALTQFDPLYQFLDVSDAQIPSQTKGRHRLRPLAVRRREAARLLGVSVSTFRRWDAAGATPSSVTVGKVALWSLRSLRLWMELGCPSRAAFNAMEAARRTDVDRGG